MNRNGEGFETSPAPVGYLIDPPEVDLPEGRKATALVYEWIGS